MSSSSSSPSYECTPINAILPAIESVRAYYRTGVSHSYEWRVKQLESLQRMVNDNSKAVIDAIYADFRKPHVEALLYETENVLNECREMLRSLPDLMKDRHRPTPIALLPGHSKIHYEPYGVVLVIVPFNYPFQLLFSVLVSVWAAGNVAVIKPSEFTPHLNTLTKSLMKKYFDPKSFALIEGGVEEMTELLKHQFDYIMFTGSTAVGKVVMKAAAQHLTPVTLELGGKCPAIVHEDANLEVTARRIVWGRFQNAGQACIAVDYVLVHHKVRDRLLKLMSEQIVKSFGEDAQKSKDFGRIVNGRHTQRLVSMLQKDKDSIIFGGKIDVKDNFIGPTIVNATPSSSCMQDEIFGPILPVMTYSKIEEAIQFVNSRPKPLGLYIFSSSTSVQDVVMNKTSSGGACINDALMHFANSALPFGGVGASGMGAYHGVEGFYTFSHAKSILHKSYLADAKARYAPYSPSKIAIMKWAQSVQMVNSDTFSKIFYNVILPAALVFAGHKMGFRISKL